jgi:hypothetical protein
MAILHLSPFAADAGKQRSGWFRKSESVECWRGSEAMILGIGLGILIGLLSGTVALILLRTANSLDTSNVKSVITITAEILAIPTFWFAGSWLTRLGIENRPPEFLDLYVITLAATFSMLLAYPIYRWIFKLGHELGREMERNA